MDEKNNVVLVINDPDTRSFTGNTEDAVREFIRLIEASVSGDINVVIKMP